MGWIYKRAVWWWLRTNATICDYIRKKHSKRRSGESNTINEKGKGLRFRWYINRNIKSTRWWNTNVITNFCNIIYSSGVIPTDLKQSVFITLPKKSKAPSCTECRTISLINHITKLLLKVIEQGIVKNIDNEVSRLQSGFRSGSDTREGIFNLRTVCEQANDLGRDVYTCFIAYTKAFDRVKHSKIIECLSEIGIDDKKTTNYH